MTNKQKEETMNRDFSFCFGGVGSLGEELALYMYPNSIGSASKGGCAFDNKELDSEKKISLAREIKFVCLDGSKECKSCKSKCPRFQKKCISCEKTEFKFVCDSRAGISAKAHIKYREIKEVIIFISKFDDSSNTIKLFCYKFDCENEYFNKYIHNQNDNGKGNTCNFQPFSYDWFCSGPIKLMEFDISENGLVESFYNLENTQVDDIPYMNWNTQKAIFTSKEISDLGLSKDEFPIPYEKIKNNSVRNKNLGKERGVTTRK